MISGIITAITIDRIEETYTGIINGTILNDLVLSSLPVDPFLLDHH